MKPRPLVVSAMLMAGSLSFLFPLFWMVSTSLKTTEEILAFPPPLLPARLVWANYAEAFTIVPLLRFFLNSLFVVGMCVVGNVATAAMCAFGFARLRAPGKEALFALYLATMMLPAQVTMIPVFVLFQKLGWLDTYYPLIVPAYMGGGAFNVFLLRQFFLKLPRDLEEAALIDGCGWFRIFFTISLPLAKPALMTVAIFAFMYHWNDFINPLIYLHDQDKYTLALGLNLFKGLYVQKTPWGPLMAASTLAVVPVVLMFLVLQRYFVEGVALSGIKE